MVVGYGTNLYRHIVPNGCSSAVTQRSISSNDVFPVRSKRPESIQTNRTEQEIRYNTSYTMRYSVRHRRKYFGRAGLRICIT